MAKSSSKHVVPNAAGGWAVRNSGAARVTRIFDTQAEAVRYGRSVAKKAHVELYVHRRDGMIQSKDSYGNEPIPPKDKK
jgi:uncharacterized protein YdaT